MRWLSACAVILLGICACSGNNSIRKQAQELSFEKVTMHRSACLGRCPVYTVKVSSNGKVAFHGEKFVASSGKRVGIAYMSDLVRLDQAIAAAGFLSLRREYQSGDDGCTLWVTDQSTVDINVTTGGTAHPVTYYYGCTVDVGPSIDKLSKTIDEIARVHQWVGHRAL